MEITELVDQKARQLNEKGKKRSPQKLYRLWEDEEIIQKLEGILKQKDGKCEKIKKRTEIFRKTVLLIHTDEDEITGQRIVAILEKKCFEALNNIDDAYLMLSYDPSIKRYPIFTLALEKSK